MEVVSRNWRPVVQGLIFSVVYGALMLSSWRLSVDQWYLPAGIRLAALLFLPTRFWPYILAGDAAAFLTLRVPKAEQYGELWAYLSPFLLGPAVAIVPAIFRRQLGVISDRERWFPVIALATAVWTAIANMTINFALSGPSSSGTVENFLRFSAGQYLGMVIFVPAVMVWIRRKDGMFCPRQFSTHLVVAVALTAVAYFAANYTGSEPALRQLLLLLMIVPAVVLTFMHGWRGAALGIAVASVAFGLPTTAFDAAGAHDAVAFVVQIALAIATVALYVFGAAISAHYDHARKLGVAERHALKIAHSSFVSRERHLRESVIALAQLQSGRDEDRRNMARWLEEMGHTAAAADLQRVGKQESRLFDEHAAALYPLRIERHGLFDVLQSVAFSSVWAGGRDVRFVFRGAARALSVDLQLAAYRCACNAVALLAQGAPIRQTVRARVWAGGEYRGIVVSIEATAGQAIPPNQTATLAALELEGRINANGGAVKRRHANRISFLLVEPVGPTSDRQRSPAGVTAHQSPLVV